MNEKQKINLFTKTKTAAKLYCGSFFQKGKKVVFFMNFFDIFRKKHLKTYDVKCYNNCM